MASVAVIFLSSCNWKIRPTYPADKIAESLRRLCSENYKLAVESRHAEKTLQAVVWKVGLFNGRVYDLQGMRREAMEAMEHVFLSATRIALSTDAPLDFIEVKLADVLTGATITLWRYVPDIRDSMYQRIGDTEYFSRLVIEVDVDKDRPANPTGMVWEKPLTMKEFLAKQIISRARRDGAETMQAHPDLSEPTTLGVVIENWPAIEEEGPENVAKVTDSIHKSAQTVLKGYRFPGFRGVKLLDADGVAVSSWVL